ncbi:MAG: acetyl-CoA synthase subunit gamma [Bacteroidetes bacterium]|nr:acetyl-CoA synthase subunit gamma [Bacteroidota bacterium]
MKGQGFTLEQKIAVERSVPVVSTRWSLADRLGAMKARWAINRNTYKIDAGLYGVGSPDETSRVFVTANYKLSFDHLRTALNGIDAWILVLDTRGINVWCAGGKGSFGTEELVRRIQMTKLNEVFHVIFGPVRAADIKPWLAKSMAIEPGMREARFRMYDRLILTGVEMSVNFKSLVFTSAFFFILSGLNTAGYSIDLAIQKGGNAIICLTVAYLGGTFLTPLFLPFIPFRAFSLKGGFTGLVLTFLLFPCGIITWSPLFPVAWAFMIVAACSYLVMNFTGSSPISNLSGVLIEVKRAVPFQIGFAAIGLIIYIIALFL